MNSETKQDFSPAVNVGRGSSPVPPSVMAAGVRGVHLRFVASRPLATHLVEFRISLSPTVTSGQ